MAQKNDYLFIWINADNINYMPALRLLRDATNALICIVSSNYTKQEAGDAYDFGADLFEPLSNRPKDNFKTVMGKINSMRIRAMLSFDSTIFQKIISFGDIVLNTSYLTVFIRDKELKLAKIELNILQYMMDNPVRILTHDAICEFFLKVEYNAATPDAIYSLMKRIRGKIRLIAPSQSIYIETITDIGYRLKTIDNDSKY